MSVRSWELSGPVHEGTASTIDEESRQLIGFAREVWSSGRAKIKKAVRTTGPQTHHLPSGIMWTITILTALSMAVINFFTVWVISFIVQWKFRTMQVRIDRIGISAGIATLAGICVGLATLCCILLFVFAPGAASSGAPENKGWLNGNHIPGLFTTRHLVVRALATILANTAGFPVGREGPTVTMGSNVAYLITHAIALPYVRQWISLEKLSSERYAALVIDDERFAHAKRIICTVGGACGMAMLFDSPIGGIVYMFEEITAASWPLEVTLLAFAGTTVCALISRGLLGLCGTSPKAFVVYDWTPASQPWAWKDMPFFCLLALAIGPFSAFHTKACLAVAAFRQRIFSIYSASQPASRILDALFYAALCASAYAVVALQAKCFAVPSTAAEQLVRYNCEEGQYNPVASLLLTTSEGAVKRLFSRDNVNEIHAGSELLAFLIYSCLNIGLTGVSVPSGNFTGSMLIGGLAGRLFGALLHRQGFSNLALSGVYAMVGSAAMLAGFKQMSVAVVIFITGCANDLNLMPPLMLSVTVSLACNRAMTERGFDEEQIERKNIPFLQPDPPSIIDATKAAELMDVLPRPAILPPEASGDEVRQALACSEVSDFPVVRADNVCIGFTTRARLEAAKHAQKTGSDFSATDSDEGEEQLSLYMSGAVGREVSHSIDGLEMPLPVCRLADRSPYTILHDMPAPRLYPLFAKAGARVACVVSEDGTFRGMISRAGLIATTRLLQKESLEDGGDESDSGPA